MSTVASRAEEQTIQGCILHHNIEAGVYAIAFYKDAPAPPCMPLTPLP